MALKLALMTLVLERFVDEAAMVDYAAELAAAGPAKATPASAGTSPAN